MSESSIEEQIKAVPHTHIVPNVCGKIGELVYIKKLPDYFTVSNRSYSIPFLLSPSLMDFK